MEDRITRPEDGLYIQQTGFLSTSYNPYWSSSLFNEVYLRNESGPEFITAFENRKEELELFIEHFLNFCTKRGDFCKRKRSEADTIRDIIIPVMKMLGWHDNCDISIDESPYVEEFSFTVSEGGNKKIYRSDLLLVDDPENLKFFDNRKSNEKKIAAAKDKNRGAIMIVEAKKWDELDFTKYNNIKSDNSKKLVEEVTGQTYEEQVLTYMSHLGLQYGILTDGKVWKLFHVELSHGDFKKRSFDFNLGKLVNSIRTGNSVKDVQRINEDNLRLFFSMFSKKSLFSSSKRSVPFVHQLLNHSKKYAIDIEAELKDRFVAAMGIACNAYKRSISKSKMIYDLDLIRNTAESHLFNILFVRSCESRRILPIQAPAYQRKSLAYIIGQMDEMSFDPEDIDLKGFSQRYREQFEISTVQGANVLNGTELYDHLMDLYTTIHDGTKNRSFGFEIVGFKESVFSKEEWKLAQKHKIDNKSMLLILFHLNFTEAPGKSTNIKKYQQIPYSFFIPRQLGSIYESFLEFTLEEAEEYLVFHKKRWRTAQKGSEKVNALLLAGSPTVEKGELFFTPNNKDRKMSGSYYTPDNIVSFMVKNVVDLLLKANKHREISSLRICDPAMGSGHYLGGALQYLTAKKRQEMAEETLSDVTEPIEVTARRILDTCLYGVDINERAVKLSKLSLWLMSAHAGRKLERLDDQLKVGNSVLNDSQNDSTAFNWEKEFPNIFKEGGFDSFIGNPPYIGHKGGQKKQFEKIKKTSLGQRFNNERMDIFYYFFHLALDKLKNGGLCSYITTNYFVNADSAVKLRADLRERCSLTSFINFNELKVFEGAGGQHNMITTLSKSKKNTSILIVDTKKKGKLTNEIFHDIISNKDRETQKYYVEQPKLFEGENNYIRIATSKERHSNALDSLFLKMNEKSYKLGEIAELSQGIVTGIDRISKKHIEGLNRFSKGEGVFVLTSDELNRLNIPESEMDIVKPWFKNSDISQFTASNEVKKFLIYSTIDVDWKKHPTLEQHIFGYQAAIRMRNFDSGELSKAMKSGAWWALSSARRSFEFDLPKIVSPQRSLINKFGLISEEWTASADVYFITKPKMNIKCLTALLNSKAYYVWLYHKGKRKGDMLELYLTPLSEIPIPEISQEKQEQVAFIVSRILKNGEMSKKDFDEINLFVYKVLNLSKKEISMIEDLYPISEVVEADGKMENLVETAA